MYKSIFQIPVRFPCNNQSKQLPCMARSYCSFAKSRKKRVSKVDVSDGSKLSNPDAISEKVNSNGIDEVHSKKPVCKDPKSSKTNLIVDKPLLTKKKQKQTAIKDDNKTMEEKENIKSSFYETDPNKSPTLSLAERYGDSLSIPGIKPFSCVKKKKELPKEKSSVKNSEYSANATSITEDTAVPAFQDTTNFSEVVPKLRPSSFRLEQKLTVPSEWADVAERTPSMEFLNSILEFPLDNLKKTTYFCEKNTEYVRCFKTENHSATKVVPAVTTILSKTMTPAQAFGLKLWREKLTKQLGEEGFQKHKTEILTRGKQFHDTIQRYLHGEPVQSLNVENLPLITGCWKSLVPVLNRIDGVIAVESEVLHPHLLYKGVIDCIVEIQSQPFIVEWKHSNRKRESLQKNYDSPVQLMAYAGAINSNTCYPFGIKNSLLVVAYDDGSPADVFLLSAEVNGENHWQTWLKRLHTYWTLLKAERELET